MEPQEVAQANAPRVAVEPVIPSVPGEFYSYSCDFSVERPLGYLMKCKANKSRSITDVQDYVHELDLTFLFGNGVSVCSPNTDPSVGLLDDFVEDLNTLNQTWITCPNITEDAFYTLRQQKDGQALAAVCKGGIAFRDVVVPLWPGKIVAVATESGKYGLFLVKELTPTSVKLDACHILL